MGVAPLLLLSLAFDAIWIFEIVPFRNDEYEPIPVSILVIPFGIPTSAAASVFGVSLRLGTQRAGAV